MPAVGDLAGSHDLVLGVGGESRRRTTVSTGSSSLTPLACGLLHHLLGVVHPVGLQQGVADLAALGLGEGVGHAAADDDGVGDLQQVVDDADLVG